MLLLTTAIAAVTQSIVVCSWEDPPPEKSFTQQSWELTSFDLMLRGSKHFYFILAKTTNEWHMVVHSSTSTAVNSSRWFCPAAVPPPSHHHSMMLSSPRTMLLSSDNAVFKDLWSRSPTTYQEKKSAQIFKDRVRVSQGYLLKLLLQQQESWNVCERPFLEDMVQLLGRH